MYFHQQPDFLTQKYTERKFHSDLLIIHNFPHIPPPIVQHLCSFDICMKIKILIKTLISLEVLLILRDHRLELKITLHPHQSPSQAAEIFLVAPFFLNFLTSRQTTQRIQSLCVGVYSAFNESKLCWLRSKKEKSQIKSSKCETGDSLSLSQFSVYIAHNTEHKRLHPLSSAT